MFKGNRSVEERILLFLTGLVVLSIAPFVVIRVIDGSYLLAGWNSMLTIVNGAMFVYVYKTHNVKVPGIFMSVTFVMGSILTVWLKGGEQVYWVFPAFIGTFYLMNPRGALVLCLLAFSLVLPVLVPAYDSVVLVIICVSLIMNIVFAFVFSLMTKNQRDKLTELSRTDPLTGVLNRRVLNERLASVYAVFQRSQLPVSLLMLDIDHFKNINDTYGHYVGDEILVKLTKMLGSNVRVSDSLYRYGGEEFVIVAENTSVDAAYSLAEKLRTLIQSSIFIKDIEVTVSIGVAELQQNETQQDWLSRSDQALLSAKREGRNLTVQA